MFEQNISTDDSTYYNHFRKRVIGFMGSITGRILKNRATISGGKDKNFPE